MDALTKQRLAASRAHRHRLTNAGTTGLALMEARAPRKGCSTVLRDLSDIADTKQQAQTMRPVQHKSKK